MSNPPEFPTENEDADAEEDILHWVTSHVWSGKYGAEEIALSVEDQFDEADAPDGDWLRQVIGSAIAAKRKEEQAWPPVTDCDRLDRAFENLARQGGIALHMAGYTQSDGLSDVEDVYVGSGGESSRYAGHCFYTMQDQEGALEGCGLFIGFGHLSGDDEKGVEFGRMVRAALEREGLRVEWDGTISTRLHVEGFRWQRRTPR